MSTLEDVVDMISWAPVHQDDLVEDGRWDGMDTELAAMMSASTPMMSAASGAPRQAAVPQQLAPLGAQALVGDGGGEGASLSHSIVLTAHCATIF